eukprot:NODE_159_length_15043_cov_0.440444.p4 type:complete len:460 gc:universal NODE_159_length_15043_cov_0.440444:859-2238(+)
MFSTTKLTSKAVTAAYIPGVKGFAPGYPKIGPYRSADLTNIERKLPSPPKIKEVNLSSPIKLVRYNEELKALRYKYLEETFNLNKPSQKELKIENVDGLAGPRRLRKQILLQYPEEQMSIPKRNALAIHKLFEERIKVLQSERNLLLLRYKEIDENGNFLLSKKNEAKILDFLKVQIGTAPELLKHHLGLSYDLNELLYNDVLTPRWDHLTSKKTIQKENMLEEDSKKLENLLELFHSSASFVCPSNVEDVCSEFVKNVELKIDSTPNFQTQVPNKLMEELFDRVIEDGVVPDNVDNHVGGQDNPSIKFRSQKMKERAQNLFKEETLQTGKNLASISAFTPDTSNPSTFRQDNLEIPNVSSSASSVPLHRQRHPRAEKYAYNEEDVMNRRLAASSDIPSTKEDHNFTELKYADINLLKRERENELIDSYRGTVNGKFGVEQVLVMMSEIEKNDLLTIKK